MQQTNSGITLSLLLAISLLISGCSGIWSKPEKEVVVQTKIVEKNIPIVPRPKGVQLHDIKIYVVSPSENFEKFKKDFEAKNGGDSYVAISIKDYENLSANFAELRRYIAQQKAIIVYYEKAVKPKEEEKK